MENFQHANQIRLLREAARLSQSHLAVLSGIRRDRLCYAEMGRLNLRPDEVGKIRQVVADQLQTIQTQVMAALLVQPAAQTAASL
jgi:transcriptional regulator with XRE-family HTH domain